MKGYIPSEVIDEIIFNSDIIDFINGYTSLKQKGNSYFGLCPFHRESSPSFSVSSDKQLFHCFGCGESGNVVGFVMKKENLDYIDAIEFLAEKINYTITYDNTPAISKQNELKDRLYEIHKKSARYFYDNLIGENGKVANDYLDKRGVLLSIRRKYGLGYSLDNKTALYNFLKNLGYSDGEIVSSGLIIKTKNSKFIDRFYNRIMFPIIDIRGRIIGFGGRTLDTDKSVAKYLNSPETPIFSKSMNLYNMNFTKTLRPSELILVEGYMDVIALSQIGIMNSVASLGTAFNQNHVDFLKKYVSKVILLFDSDEAGEKAIFRALPFLLSRGISVKVLQVKGSKDPDEYIKKYGPDSFKKLLKSSISHIIFQIQVKLRDYNLDDISDKIQFTKEVALILSKVENSIEREVYTSEIERITGISFKSINNEIEKLSIFSDVNLFKKPNNFKKHQNKLTALDDAKNNLLYLIYKHNDVYNSVKNILSPDEFVDDFYIKFAKYIYNFKEKDGVVKASEIVNLFENIDEQKKVSQIFMIESTFDDNLLLEKAVNDHVKIIKKVFFEEKLVSSSDINLINSIFNEKKKLESLHITIAKS